MLQSCDAHLQYLNAIINPSWSQTAQSAFVCETQTDPSANGKLYGCDWEWANRINGALGTDFACNSGGMLQCSSANIAALNSAAGATLACGYGTGIWQCSSGSSLRNLNAYATSLLYAAPTTPAPSTQAPSNAPTSSGPTAQPTALPSTRPTASPTTSGPTTAPSAFPTIAPTVEVRFNASCEEERSRVEEGTQARRLRAIYIGEPVALAGFRFKRPGQTPDGGDGSTCDRQTAFAGAAGLVIDAANVTFKFETDAPENTYDVMVNPRTGALVITALERGVAEPYSSRIYIWDAYHRASALVAAWDIEFMERAPFALSANGTAEVGRIRDEIDRKRLAGNTDVNTTVLVPGFDTATFTSKADLFEHYSLDEENTPEVVYRYTITSALCIDPQVAGWPAILSQAGAEISCTAAGTVCSQGGRCVDREAWATAAGAEVVPQEDNTFLNAASGRMLVKLETIGTFQFKLWARTKAGGDDADVFLFELNVTVRLPDHLADGTACSGRGTPRDDDVRQDRQYLCDCDPILGYTGDFCEVAPTSRPT